MTENARQVADGSALQGDLCNVGAGTAGSTLASGLDASCESGALEQSMKALALWLEKRRIPNDAVRRVRDIVRDLPNANAAVGARLPAELGPPTHW